MKNLTALLITFALVFGLSACAGEEAPQTPQGNNIRTNPEITEKPQEQETENPQNSENETPAAVTWLAEPIYAYDWFIYCSSCNVFIGNPEGENLYDDIIDEKTAVPTGEKHGGHGGDASMTWVFDPALNLFGYEVAGNIEIHPINEFAEKFPDFVNQINIVYLVDSTMRGEGGYFDGEHFEWEAFGKSAAAHGNNFLTEFIYDEYGSIREGRPADNFVALSKDGKYGIIDKSGNIIIPFDFENILIIDENSAFAEYGGKFGIISIA